MTRFLDAIKKKRFFYSLLCLAILIRITYLLTAQSNINGEEAMFGVEAISFIKSLNMELDWSSTRLYTITPYVTALVFYLFGISTINLKVVSLVFSIIYILIMWKLSKKIFSENTNIQKLVIVYIVLSPALLNIWSLKARGGFIETLAIGTLILYLTIKYSDVTDFKVLILGYLGGIAFWIHPMTMSYTLTSFIILAFYLYRSKLKIIEKIKKVFILGLGSFIGVLPLIIINMYFKFNTFKYLFGATAEGSSITYLEKIRDLIFQALPMLLGIRHEWEHENILPRIITVPFFVLILVLCFFVVLYRLKRLKKGIQGIDVLILFSLIHSLLIITTSWGSFLLEPRRALPLYSALPFLIFYSFTILKNKKYIYLITALVLFVNIFSNIDYINKNIKGYNNFYYNDFTNATKFLTDNSINHIFTNSWYGFKLTFESKGEITWSRTQFLPASYGFKTHDTRVTKNNAFVFSFSDETEINNFERKLILSGIVCKKVNIDGLIIFFGFSDQFDIETLYNQ